MYSVFLTLEIVQAYLEDKNIVALFWRIFHVLDYKIPAKKIFMIHMFIVFNNHLSGWVIIGGKPCSEQLSVFKVRIKDRQIIEE